MNGAALAVAALGLVAVIAIGAILVERRSDGEPGMRRMDTMRQKLGRATTESDVVRNSPLRPTDQTSQVRREAGDDTLGASADAGGRSSSTHGRAGPEAATFRDPVCGAPVTRAGAPAKAVHRGRTYFFCSTECARAFERGASLWREP